MSDNSIPAAPGADSQPVPAAPSADPQLIPPAPVPTQVPTTNPVAEKKSKLPLLALIFAGVALLFAFAAAGIAWMFAITAIVLAIIALVKKAEPRKFAIIAIIVAPIAWMISIIVAIAMLAAGITTAVDDTKTDAPGLVEVTDEAEEEAVVEEEAVEEPTPEPEAPSADGSKLDSPLPFGTTVSIDSWTSSFDVSFGEINWDATAVIEAENMFNPDPATGSKYIMVPVTITNTGDAEWSPHGTFFWADIKLVSNGRGFSEGTVVVAPNSLSDQGDLYPGGVATGNVVFEVPADVSAGVWDVDGTFVVA